MVTSPVRVELFGVMELTQGVRVTQDSIMNGEVVTYQSNGSTCFAVVTHIRNSCIKVRTLLSTKAKGSDIYYLYKNGSTKFLVFTRGIYKVPRVYKVCNI
jgi:hypothetical protein